MNGKKSLTRPRRFRDRVTAVLASAGLIAMTSGLIVMAASTAAQADADLTTVCHVTNSDTNPYEVLGVGSADGGGHNGHRGPDSTNDQLWHKTTLWNGVLYLAGTEKFDLVEGLDEELDGLTDEEAEDFCLAVGVVVDDIPVTPTVTKVDRCGTANDSYNVVADESKFTFEATGTPASGSVSIAFTEEDGYVIQGPNPVVLTFTNVPCPVDLTEVVPAITMADPCGTAKDKVNGVDKTGYSFEVNGNKVKFTADEGYVLDGPSVLTAEFTNVACPEIVDTETPKPDKEPTIEGTEAVPTAVAAGIGGNGPTMTGSSPIDLLAQMLVGGGLALLMAAGWLQIGRQTHGVHQV